MGSIYALVATGLTLVFGVMRVINFAHGDFLMVAMYAALTMVTLFGLDPYLTILVTAPLLFLFALIVFRLVIARTLKGPEINQLLITLALGIILQNLITILYTSNPRSINVPYASSRIILGPVVLTYTRLFALLLAASSAAVLYWLLYRTALGRTLRAASQNRDAANLMGIHVESTYMLAFGIGLACLGVAGPSLLPIMYASPDIGTAFTLTAFVVVVLGGLGSFGGALVGGLAIGLVESLGRALLPGSYGQALPYLLFIVVLLLRPQGLFGVKAR